MNEKLNCKYVGKCGGCPAGMDAFAPSAKLAAVRGMFADARVAYSPRERVRDRVDLVWENGRLGLYGLNDQVREIVDLEACPMMTEPLEGWFKAYRAKTPPIRKGSVRLRVSPAGKRGVWLDFANQDVKALFEEKNYLEWLSQQAFVEIGQRRKHLIWRDGAPKLVDPELQPWFETYGAEMQAIPLYGPVGGFSQTGFDANRALVTAVTEFAAKSGVRDWVELFSGNGNFALALAARGHKVEAVEMDELAVQGMQLSMKTAGLEIGTLRSDVYLQTGKLPQLAGRGLLVDPPRAGLREVLHSITSENAPRALLYVSCFTETFVDEAEKLIALGYRVKDLVAIEQFPYTNHSEWVALLERVLVKE